MHLGHMGRIPGMQGWFDAGSQNTLYPRNDTPKPSARVQKKLGPIQHPFQTDTQHTRDGKKRPQPGTSQLHHGAWWRNGCSPRKEGSDSGYRTLPLPSSAARDISLSRQA